MTPTTGSSRRDWQVAVLATALLHAAVLVMLFVRVLPAQRIEPAPPSLSIELLNAPPAPVAQPKPVTSQPHDRPRPRPATPDVPTVPRGLDPIPIPVPVPVPSRANDTPPPRPDSPVTPPRASAVAQAEQNRIASDASANPQARETWESAVLARLEGAKRYPASARFAHQEATIYARFVVDRKGSVVQAELVKSSGYPDLDGEVRSLLRRVRLPAPPAAVPDMALTMTVPIEFTLNRQ
jgi:protein TonB